MATVSPAQWWRGLNSVPGVTVLLGLSVVMLIAGLVATWPRR